MDKTLQIAVMYVLTHTGLIFFLYPSDIIESVVTGHWLPVLAGFMIHMTMLVLFLYGMSAFKHENLIRVFLRHGKVLATVLLLPVLAYLLTVLIIGVRAYSESIILVFLSNTPLWAVMVLLLGISAFLASLGLEALFRTGMLLALLFIPSILFIVCSSFQNVDWHYLLPLVDRKTASLSFMFEQPFLKSLFAFSSVFLLLGFVQPVMAFQSKKIVLASVLLLPLFLVSVYVPILTFGPSTAVQFQFPYVMTIDTVQIRWLMFDRSNMFFLLSVITFVILFMAVVMRVIVQIIGLDAASPKLHIPLVILLALGVFIVCMRIPDWKLVIEMFWWNTPLRLYVLTVIPGVVFALGLRQRKKVQRYE